LMAFLCQRHDGNLWFPHPHPSPATTVFVFGTAARAGEGGRWPKGGTNLEYGASAVFPCGVIPATDRQGRAPAFGPLPSYALRVFLERDRRRRRWILVDVDQCGSVAVPIGRWF
jgi:hypothetical protein